MESGWLSRTDNYADWNRQDRDSTCGNGSDEDSNAGGCTGSGFDVSVAPEDFAGLNFEVFSLQPLDGTNIKKNTKKTLDYIVAHPKWRLSLQAHKIWGIA